MSVDYNGTSDVSKSSASPVSATAFTMCAWVYSDTTSGTRYAFGLQNPSNSHGWRLGFNGTAINLQCVGASSQNTPVSSAAASGQWMHLGMVCGAVNSRIIYKNGVSIGTGTASIAPSGVNQIRIGAGTNSSGTAVSFWNGRVAAVCLWNAALTASEMASLGAGAFPLSIRSASVRSWHPLGGFYPHDVNDYWNGGYNLDSIPAASGQEPRIYHIGWGGLKTAATAASATLTADYAAFSLTGQAAATRPARAVVASQASYSLAGQTASLRRGYTLTASSATFSETGYSATLSARRQAVASQASFALTGQSVSVPMGRTLVASHGSLSLSGSNAATMVSRAMLAGVSTVSLTGQDAGLSRQSTLATASGEYSLTGSDVQFGSPKILAAQQASFSLTGNDAAVSRVRSLSCETASLALSGEASAISAQRFLASTQASFSESGQDASLRRSLALPCEATQVAVTGQDSNLLRTAVASCISAAFEMTAPNIDLTLRALTAERPYVDSWSSATRDRGSEFFHRRTSSLELQLESSHKRRRESRTTGLVQ